MVRDRLPAIFPLNWGDAWRDAIFAKVSIGDSQSQIEKILILSELGSASSWIEGAKTPSLMLVLLEVRND